MWYVMVNFEPNRGICCFATEMSRASVFTFSAEISNLWKFTSNVSIYLAVPATYRKIN